MLRCPECNSTEVITEENIPYLFPYGMKPNQIMLEVQIPIRKCQKCGFQYMDHESEDIIDAINKAGGSHIKSIENEFEMIDLLKKVVDALESDDSEGMSRRITQWRGN